MPPAPNESKKRWLLDPVVIVIFLLVFFGFGLPAARSSCERDHTQRTLDDIDTLRAAGGDLDRDVEDIAADVMDQVPSLNLKTEFGRDVSALLREGKIAQDKLANEIETYLAMELTAENLELETWRKQFRSELERFKVATLEYLKFMEAYYPRTNSVRTRHGYKETDYSRIIAMMPGLRKSLIDLAAAYVELLDWTEGDRRRSIEEIAANLELVEPEFERLYGNYDDAVRRNAEAAITEFKRLDAQLDGRR